MVLKNNKSLGQHWLRNRLVLNYIAFQTAAVGSLMLDQTLEEAIRGPASKLLPEKDRPKLCVEIGPGLGTLTSSLLKRFDKVIAVEYDARLAANLPKSFPGKSLQVEHADILKYDFSSIQEPYVVVGNIPYYITSPIIDRLLHITPRPSRIVLLVQKEVAERATPVKNRENLLSLNIKNRAFVFSDLVLTRDMFTPPPKVDSQLLIMEPHPPLVTNSALALAKIGFSSPRKKLLGNLTHGLGLGRDQLTAALQSIGVSPDCRPADLSLQDWRKLEKEIKKHAATN